MVRFLAQGWTVTFEHFLAQNMQAFIEKAGEEVIQSHSQFCTSPVYAASEKADRKALDDSTRGSARALADADMIKVKVRKMQREESRNIEKLIQAQLADMYAKCRLNRGEWVADGGCAFVFPGEAGQMRY
jgi:uncharacterized protein YpuA (DUF1002 family)